MHAEHDFEDLPSPNAPNPGPGDHSDSDTPPLLTLERLRAATSEEQVSACGLVLRSDVALDRHHLPYLVLRLRGADGSQIQARWWRYPFPVERRPAVGQVCWLWGFVELYLGEMQLRVVRARPAEVVTPHAFVKTSARTLEDLQADLEQRIGSLRPELSTLVRATLSKEVYDRFCVWPAAQQRHGAVRHGLLAHSLRVVALAHALAAAYAPLGLPYGPMMRTSLPPRVFFMT